MRTRGFTFVELVIVAIIISVLMAIAVPNFLEARTRAMVTRTRGSTTAIAAALEGYRSDWRAYPPNRLLLVANDAELIAITTPVAYMVSLPPIYDSKAERWSQSGYNYLNVGQAFDIESSPFRSPAGGVVIYTLSPVGPTGKPALNAKSPATLSYIDYDPTNGTTSAGDHNLYGP